MKAPTTRACSLLIAVLALACRRAPQGPPEGPLLDWSPCGGLRVEEAEPAAQVLRADLDGDGVAERIAVRRKDLETEAGAVSATVSIEAGPSWSAQDPGEGSFAWRSGEAGCVVVATEWLAEAGRRGNARFVFAGRWFQLAAGRLEPLREQPVILRRNLPDFELERPAAAGGLFAAAPLRWLSSPEAEPRSEDPYLQGKETFRLIGAVTGVEIAGGRLEVQTQVPGFLARLSHDPDPAEETGNTFGRLGDWASGRLYPPDYLPADPAQWLVGRQVSLTTYRRGREPPRRVLWVGRPL